MTPKAELPIMQRLRNFISSYSHFADEQVLTPLSLWIAGTYLYEGFDAFPYLTITAHVKRAGKTRLSELIGFTCSSPFSVSGASGASIFHAIEDRKPTIIWDEAETLSSEASNLLRAVLNVGYRKGQTIPRVSGDGGVKEWPTYCPKVFVLIGDVYDTLRDRSIVIEMERKEPKNKFRYEPCKLEGNAIGEEIKLLIAANLEKIIAAYESEDLNFLTDRDEEIWRPLFALAKVIDKESYTMMRRIAVDMATLKTAPTKQIDFDAEKQAEKEEYAFRLLADLVTVSSGKEKGIESKEAIKRLRDIDVAPWRKYQGEGLTMQMLADLLAIVELWPKAIRGKYNGKFTGSGQAVYRGYLRSDILTSAKKYAIVSVQRYE